MCTLNAVDAAEKPPIDDVPSDLHQDARKGRVGYHLQVPAQAEAGDGSQT